MPDNRRLVIKLLRVGLLTAATVIATQGCQSADGKRPPVPNSATEAADARSFGPIGVPPECCTDGKVAGAYPGPGPNGVVCGYVAAGLDSRCWWRQRSSGVAGAVVSLFSAGPDGKLDSSDDTLVATATSGSSGCYELSAVEIPGSYVVKLSEPAVAVCDSDTYEYPDAGEARAELGILANVAIADFGVTP